MEPGVSDQGIDLPIQVAATSQPMPQRVQPVLPRLHVAVRREAMLDEDEVTIRLQHTPHFLEAVSRAQYSGVPIVQRKFYAVLCRPPTGTRPLYFTRIWRMEKAMSIRGGHR